MREKNSEIEPNAPDWSSEEPSDQLLVRELRKKLDKPFWRRRVEDWRNRRKIEELIEKLKKLGFS